MVIKDMAKRAMSQVVAETCDCYVADLFLSYIEIRLMLFEQLHLFAGEEASSDAMLCSFVCSTRENLVAEAKLLESLEALELRSVNDVPVDGLEGEDSVHWVVDLAQGQNNWLLLLEKVFRLFQWKQVHLGSKNLNY